MSIFQRIAKIGPMRTLTHVWMIVTIRKLIFVSILTKLHWRQIDMAKYNVPLDICVHSYQEIEADSVEEALKTATDNIYALGFDKVITNNGFYVFQDMDDCIEEIEDE